MATTLTIHSQTLSQRDLLAGGMDPSSWSDNERAALDFCRRWLSGQTEFVVHTSGSTGAPKPVTLHRQQMEASAQATAQALDLRAGMSALVCLPVRYIAGQMMLARGLALDLAMALVEPVSDPLAGLPSDAVFDFTALVPLQLQTLLDGPAGYRGRLNRMKAILVGGAAVSPALEQQVHALDAPVYHTYGMTETATHIALRRLNGPDASPWFRPLPGVEIDTDARGCLRLKGPMTQDCWLQTNDLVDLARATCDLRPAAFRWLGRWDNVINSGGVKVQVELVEAAAGEAWLALGLEDRRYFAAGQPDGRLGQAVALVVEGEPLPAAQEAGLCAALAQALPPYHAPRRIIYIARFSETSTSKIDRQASLASVPIQDNQACPSSPTSK